MAMINEEVKQVTIIVVSFYFYEPQWKTNLILIVANRGITPRARPATYVG